MTEYDIPHASIGQPEICRDILLQAQFYNFLYQTHQTNQKPDSGLLAYLQATCFTYYDGLAVSLKACELCFHDELPVIKYR